MKHFILSTIFTIFISLTIFAQSDLVVYSNDGVKFTLEVNGIQQNTEPTTNVKVEGITQEFISIRMLFEDNNIPPLKKSFTLVNNKETSAMLILNKKGQYKLRYMGENPIKTEAAPSQTIISYGEEPVSVVNSTPAESTAPTGETMTTSTTVTTTTVNNGTPAENETVNMNIEIGGQSVGVSATMNGMESSSSTTITETTTVTSSSSVSSNSTAVVGSNNQPLETVSTGGCDAPMPSGDFNSAVNSMNSKSFEDAKMTLAKQFTRANCLSADQIKKVMQQLTYEESKLEYAKFAYAYCLDQPNYYKVNDAFEFELTIDELNEFLEDAE